MNELKRSIGQFTLERFQTRRKKLKNLKNKRKKKKIVDKPCLMIYNIIIKTTRERSLPMKKALGDL